MLFIVTGYDHPDALERRMACRQAHVDLIGELRGKGYLLIGGALLDDAGRMVGSTIIGNFASKEAVEEVWLKREPYLAHDVWKDVTIQGYSLGPSFASDFEALLTKK